MVLLSEFLQKWLDNSPIECSISDLQNDSRAVMEGDLFIAYPGALTDGRLYMDKALEQGASAILFEPKDFPLSISLPSSIPCIAIPNLAKQLGDIACAFYKDPSAHMDVTAVTGTNGKTTIAYQLAQAHNLLGSKSAYIGTIGQGAVDSLAALDNTTPDALYLQKLFHQYHQNKINKVCMEVSSHALAQHRVDSIPFKHAIFTNLTLDHLDYHKTMDEYAQAKARLFSFDSLEYAIINTDDPYSEIMLKVLNSNTHYISYGFDMKCDVRVREWYMDIQGSHLEIASPWGTYPVHLKSIGQFNIYNSLAIFSSLMASGYPSEQVVSIMSQLHAAPGRMEIVSEAPYVLVDYAHTPDALEKALSTLSAVKKGNLWVIFGCGGDRDKSKRPVMGKAASLYADNIIITSDNPRTEDPQSIVDEIAEGISKQIPVTKIVNREEAITYAILKAKKDDIVLIAGKGHEAYQQIGSVKHPFSDQDIVRKLDRKRKSPNCA